jgi:DNA helicase HerA-like ATPase
VLSQCNTFLVHRIVNDVDQALIRRLVPDALGDLLSELPSLPTRVGMLLGWAADIPTVVEMHDLDVNYRPQSDDPPLFGVWTGDKPGSTGWTAVSDLWSAGGQAPSEVSEPDDAESQSRDSTLE